MAIWDQVATTDPAFTKPFDNGTFKGTAINPQYLYSLATRVFGPAGIGWGYELLSSEIIELDPITKVSTSEDSVVTRQEMGRARVHTARIRFWYVLDGQRGEVFGTGHTPMVYITRKGVVHIDWEYEKKSITDALTKAMALLGFGADVRMGLFEIPGYQEEVKSEIAIEQAADKEAEMVKQRQEFETWYGKTINLMATATSLHELEILYKSGKIKMSTRWATDEMRTEFENTKNTRGREIVKAQRDTSKK